MMDSEKGIVVVPDADRKIAGSVVFWSLSGDVDIARLVAEWRAAGLDEAWLPDLPTPTVALRRAVMEQRGPRRLVRPLGKRNGWAIVDEGVEKGGEALCHETKMTIRLNEIGQIVCEPDGSHAANEIRVAFERTIGQVSHGAVSGWLCRMAHRVMAVALRPSGGFYFVPQARVETWGRVVKALQAASSCEVYGIPAMRAESAVRAILSAITSETAGIAFRMRAELQHLGERGLQNRLAECEDVEAKVLFYESFLGQSLESLRDTLRALKASIAAGILSRSCRATEEGDV